jgi:hypothetical protein
MFRLEFVCAYERQNVPSKSVILLGSFKESENSMKTLTPIVTVLFLSATFVVTSCAVKETQKELNQGRRGASAEGVRASNESMQQVTRVSKIIGTPVKNPKGDNLGDIKELVLDPRSLSDFSVLTRAIW